MVKSNLPKKCIVETTNSYYSVQEIQGDIIRVIKVGQKNGYDSKTEIYYGNTLIAFIGGDYGMLLDFFGKTQLSTSVVLKVTEF